MNTRESIDATRTQLAALKHTMNVQMNVISERLCALKEDVEKQGVVMPATKRADRPNHKYPRLLTSTIQVVDTRVMYFDSRKDMAKALDVVAEIPGFTVTSIQNDEAS